MNIRTVQLGIHAFNTLEGAVLGAYALGHRTLLGQNLATCTHELFFLGLFIRCTPPFLLQDYLETGSLRSAKASFKRCLIIAGLVGAPSGAMLSPFLFRKAQTHPWAKRGLQALVILSNAFTIPTLINCGNMQLFAWQKGVSGIEALKHTQPDKKDNVNSLPLFRLFLIHALKLSQELIFAWQVDPLFSAAPRFICRLASEMVYFSTFLIPAK